MHCKKAGEEEKQCPNKDARTDTKSCWWKGASFPVPGEEKSKWEGAFAEWHKLSHFKKALKNFYVKKHVLWGSDTNVRRMDSKTCPDFKSKSNYDGKDDLAGWFMPGITKESFKGDPGDLKKKIVNG